jgi:prepilin-type N-terminal cleavage/methylation domain-containing protein
VFKRYHDIMERKNSGEASESGFTLIELLIVIVVLGVLAAIVVFSLTGVSGQSKTAACTTDAKSVEVAAAAYTAKTGDANPTQAELVPTYLRSWPSSTSYTITLSATGGNVLVAEGTGAAAAFSDSAGCPAIS